MRRAVTQLLAALHTEIHLMLPNGINGTKSPSKVSEVSHPLEGEDEADIIEGVRKHLYAPGEQEKASSMAKNSEGANKRLVAVLSMYSQVMELLILKIMLESGHAEPALQRVRSDSYLEDGVRQVHLDSIDTVTNALWLRECDLVLQCVILIGLSTGTCRRLPSRYQKATDLNAPKCPWKWKERRDSKLETFDACGSLNFPGFVQEGQPTVLPTVKLRGCLVTVLVRQSPECIWD